MLVNQNSCVHLQRSVHFTTLLAAIKLVIVDIKRLKLLPGGMLGILAHSIQLRSNQASDEEFSLCFHKI